MGRVQPHDQERISQARRRLPAYGQVYARPRSKATWDRMAERWQRCAETFNRQSAAAKPVQRHRRGAADMEHYRKAG
jgi:hypothetical protein